ncbi:MAG: response regulator [Pseudomonadota bacterium]
MEHDQLSGKRILAVDDEPDILDILREELEEFQVELDTARSYEAAVQKMSSSEYDLIVLDIMGVRGLDLLPIAVERGIPAVMLTAHALSPATLRHSIELGARAYVPKDQLGQLAPFLEDVLTLSYESAWKSVLKKLGGSFGKRFGSQWRQSEEEFWERFEKQLVVTESIIIED